MLPPGNTSISTAVAQLRHQRLCFGQAFLRAFHQCQCSRQPRQSACTATAAGGETALPSSIVGEGRGKAEVPTAGGGGMSYRFLRRSVRRRCRFDSTRLACPSVLLRLSLLPTRSSPLAIPFSRGHAARTAARDTFRLYRSSIYVLYCCLFRARVLLRWCAGC